MKTLSAVLKVLTALAAVAGAVYVVATYGDKIVAWAKGIWAKLPQCPCCEKAPEAEEAEVVEAVEEAEPVEEAEAVEEAPAEVVAAENEPVAEEADFAE